MRGITAIVDQRFWRAAHVALIAFAALFLSARFEFPIAAQSSLMFASGFESDTWLDPPGSCYNFQGCYQDLHGVDYSTNPYGWWTPPVWQPNTVGHFQLHVGTTANQQQPLMAHPLIDYMHNYILDGVGRWGSRGLYNEISNNGDLNQYPMGAGSSQDPYVIEPSVEPQGTAGDLYISYWLNFQPDMASLMSECETLADGSQWPNANQWRVPFEWKTSGDYRVVLVVRKDIDPYPACTHSGPLYWIVAGDNVANCALYHEESQCVNGGLDGPSFNQWSVENRSVAVPNGWFKLEVFWHRSSGGDGRVWMAVAGQVIVDHFGPNTGAYSDPINRIMVTQLYTSTRFPVYQSVDDLQIWSGFPTQNSGDPWYDPPYAPH